MLIMASNEENSSLTHVKGPLENIDDMELVPGPLQNITEPVRPPLLGKPGPMEDLFPRNELSIFVIGGTGVGKSSLINSLLGQKIAEVKHGPEPTKHEIITKYTVTIADVNVTIYDTRGLADPDVKDTTLVREYKQTCKNVDVVFICHDITTRMDKSSVCTLKVLAEAFKERFWEKCILVLTKGNIAKENWDEDDDDKVATMMLETMYEYCIAFHRHLVDLKVPNAADSSIPVCVAGNRKNIQLPGVGNWISNLLHACYIRCAVSCRPSVSAIAMERLGVIIQWVNDQIVLTMDLLKNSSTRNE